MSAGPYDLLITDLDGEAHGYVTVFRGDKPRITVMTDPPSIPMSSSTTVSQAGGSYDVRDANDFWRLPLNNWEEGAGQESYDYEDASASRFWDCHAVDISSRGNIKIGPGRIDNSYSGITGVIAAGLNKVWTCRNKGATPIEVITYSTDNVTWTPVTFNGGDPDGDVTSLCCDGEYMYAAFDGTDQVWRGQAGAWDAWTADASAVDMTDLAYCGGYIYGSRYQSSKAEVGYFDLSAPHAWHSISAAKITLNYSCFGLVSAGTYVYWGVTSGSQTYVYKVQHGAAADTFELVAEFPLGFIGTSLYAYLGNIYVGGYYEAPESGKGLGAIYIITASLIAILAILGEDNTEDYRVTGICGYQKHIYFVSNNSVYRWHITTGGFAHWMDLSTGTAGEMLPTGISWTDSNAMTTELSWTKTNSAISPSVSNTGGVQTNSGRQDYWVQYTADDTDLDNDVGTTMDLNIAANCDGRFQVMCIRDGTKEAFVRFYTKSRSALDPTQKNICISIEEATDVFRNHENLCPAEDAHHIRLRLKDSVAYLYIDGTMIVRQTTLPNSAAQEVFVRGGWGDNQTADGSFVANWDNLNYTNDASFGWSSMTTPVGGIAALKDSVWFAADNIGVMTSASYAVSGEMPWSWLLTSRSAFHMQSVNKFFRAIDVSHSPLNDGEQLKIEVCIDGTWGGTENGKWVTDDGFSSHTWNIDRTGCEIQIKISLKNSNANSLFSISPITGVTVRFVPPNKTKHQFMLGCTSRDKTRDGRFWDEDPARAIDFILNLARTGDQVTIETSYAAFAGRIEQVTWLPASLSKNATTSYEGTMELVAREV